MHMSVLRPAKVLTSASHESHLCSDSMSFCFWCRGEKYCDLQSKTKSTYQCDVQLAQTNNSITLAPQSNTETIELFGPSKAIKYLKPRS